MKLNYEVISFERNNFNQALHSYTNGHSEGWYDTYEEAKAQVEFCKTTYGMGIESYDFLVVVHEVEE